MSADDIWEDKEIKFDITLPLLNLRRGEQIIETLDSIEDSKGNTGEMGKMIVTNLRIIWRSLELPRINLSIGLNCLVQIQVKISTSKVQGALESLNINGKSKDGKFEFIFTNQVPGSTKLFNSVSDTFKSYESTRLYRELKLRGLLIMDGSNLNLLASEELYHTHDGVYNLSNDQGSIGFLIITNVRVVWYAASNSNYNISIPYLQIRNLKVRDSKFGMAMVFQICEESGGYILGFRIDPVEKMEELFKELTSLIKINSVCPIFGTVGTTTPAKNLDKAGLQERDDNYLDIQEVTSNSNGKLDIFAIYSLNNGSNNNKEIVYNEDLGLAIEKLPDGYTLNDLWQVLPTENLN